jgi:hypothetical protein
MAGPTDESAAKSRKIKDQAMKILRETRAKIDPHLLSAMKEKFSAMAPGMVEAAKAPAQPATKPTAQPPLPKNSARGAAAMYSQTAQTTTETAKPAKPTAADTAEPVDRQKVAQIVMEYMKLREESKTRH